MSDNTEGVSPEMADAVFELLQPKLEELIAATVTKILDENQSNGDDSNAVIAETKDALHALDSKLWVVENDTRRRFEKIEDYIRLKQRP